MKQKDAEWVRDLKRGIGKIFSSLALVVVTGFVSYLVFSEIHLKPTSSEWITDGYWIDRGDGKLYGIPEFDWSADKITILAQGSDYLLYHEYELCFDCTRGWNDDYNRTEWIKTWCCRK